MTGPSEAADEEGAVGKEVLMGEFHLSLFGFSAVKMSRVDTLGAPG